MTKKIKAGNLNTKDLLVIHQHYMAIVNCIPSIVYWIDSNCDLKGCNNRFVKWLGLTRMDDFVGTPYEQMQKFEITSEERINAFKLDDMGVLFSGEAQYDVEDLVVYSHEDKPTYFLVNRVPLFDDAKHVTGLVVVLTDITAQKKAEQTLADLSLGRKRNALKNSKSVSKAPRILMVEPDPIAQKIQQLLFETLHCRVDLAGTGRKALSLFSPGKYNLVLMDIDLQDTSGYMVAKEIREREQSIDAPVPIIALTTYKADVIQYDCNEYSMEGILMKPLTSEQAIQLVQHYIYHENIIVSGFVSTKECDNKDSVA